MIQKKSASESPRTRAQRRASRTRKQLLDAALKMFAEKGTEATTVEDITELADVGKGTFYRHFASRKEVIAALTEEILSDLAARVRAAKSPPENLKAAVKHLMNVHSVFFADKVGEFFLLFQGRLMARLQRVPDAELDAPLAAYLKEIENLLAPHLGTAGVASEKTRRLAFALLGLIWTLPSFAMIGVPSEKAEAAATALKQAFVEGSLSLLAAPSAPAPAAGSDAANLTTTKGGC